MIVKLKEKEFGKVSYYYVDNLDKMPKEITVFDNDTGKEDFYNCKEDKELHFFLPIDDKPFEWIYNNFPKEYILPW